MPLALEPDDNMAVMKMKAERAHKQNKSGIGSRWRKLPQGECAMERSLTRKQGGVMHPEHAAARASKRDQEGGKRGRGEMMEGCLKGY